MKRCLILALALGPMGLMGQSLNDLAAGASADLTNALAELDQVRREIEAERLPIAKRVTELQQLLVDRKAEFARAERRHENELTEANALEAAARNKSDQVTFIESLLSDYLNKFEARLSFIEVPRHQEMVDAVKKAGLNPDLTPAERFAQRSVLMTGALERIEGVQGGELFEGRALDPSGLVKQGKVALVGPVAMFASADGSTAGVLQQELNKSDPSVVEVNKQMSEASRALVTTGRGEVAVDPTLGNAFQMAALKETLYEKIAKGGWVMAPLIALGVAALFIAFFKWIQLVRIRLATEEDLQTVLGHLEKNDREAALRHARGIRGMSGDLLATAIEHSDEKKEYIEEILYEKMLGIRTRLERGVAFLAVTATAGPLMGLLGTVMGMIATFKLVSMYGSGDPKMLAAGISEALIATASGMTVAIPALLLHAFLNRKAKGVIGSMEKTAVGFINGVPDTEKPLFA